MRWPAALALCACGGGSSASTLALVLDIPNGPLDPQGFTSVDVVIHEPGAADVTLSAELVGGAFALGKIAPSEAATIEATLRNDSRAAVGYGRTGVAAALRDGVEIAVPVRRPIVYLAGVASTEMDAGPLWEERPATFSDLAAGATLNGMTTLTGRAVLIVSAGGELYQIAQDASATTGALTGSAHVAPVAAADHKVGAALAGDIAGEVLDGAGADDGSALAIGTTQQLVAFDPVAGGARMLAAGGAFDKVALVGGATGALAAVAIKRGASCTTSELWWAPLDGGAAKLVATGGFADVAADRGHAYYVDGCTGELGEVTAAAATKLRTLMGATGTATALAVSRDQAYVGLASQPSTLALVVAALHGSEPPRVLWSEREQQVLRPIGFPTVQRELEASSVTIGHLELGAGGDYAALSTVAHLDGDEIPTVRFPEMHIDSEELRVFDAATGGTVQRYRSTCDGSLLISPGELSDWECATVAGQGSAGTGLDHHIRSMTFQFGKK